MFCEAQQVRIADLFSLFCVALWVRPFHRHIRRLEDNRLYVVIIFFFHLAINIVVTGCGRFTGGKGWMRLQSDYFLVLWRS